MVPETFFFSLSYPERLRLKMLSRRMRPCAGSRKGYLQEPEGLGTLGFPCCEKHETYVGNRSLAGVSLSESAARLTPSSAL